MSLFQLSKSPAAALNPEVAADIRRPRGVK
jgi:hypothetical protein